MAGATRSAETARGLIHKTKRATRRRFPTEAKIRIVMERVRWEVSVAELCRREGIHSTIYYKWLKDFMEAGKGRMRGDTLAASDTALRLLGHIANFAFIANRLSPSAAKQTSCCRGLSAS